MSHSSLSFGYFSKYFFIWTANMWIKCLVLASWIGTSTTFSLKSIMFATPLITETSKFYPWRSWVRLLSYSNLTPVDRNFSIWVFIKPEKANIWPLSLLYFYSRVLISMAPTNIFSISSLVTVGLWNALNAVLSLTIYSSNSFSLFEDLLNLSSKFWIFFSNSTIWFSFSLRIPE